MQEKYDPKNIEKKWSRHKKGGISPDEAGSTNMNNKYQPDVIEKKWQEAWNKSGIYKTKDLADKPKFFALDFFPYPSGDGLHVGHTKGYTATDAVSRMKMMEGFNVLHPMGWDAFGLPAENYAIKNKIHPRISTEKNIATFRKQLHKIGFTYDWDREVSTIDPEFYKWTQWIFLKMFEKGLAYESDEPVNWCPSCKTVLANEDLEQGLCERCGTQVVQKKMKQWVLKMTAYADRLLYDLDKKDMDWEELIKEQQKNWIGRSEGAVIKFKVQSEKLKVKEESFIEVFTTRLDTIFGCTYCVVAPEHPLIKNQEPRIKNYGEVEKYIIQAQNKTNLERTELQKEKTGVELKGIKVINPFTNEEVPVWVADYVLGSYGTGAVMAVPAHDERDFEFAKKYNLPIKQSIARFFTGEGKDKPMEGKNNVERDVVDVIIKHWSEEKFYCLDWEKHNWKTFVIGGVEKAEKKEDAVIREAMEETGYQNIKLVKKIGWEIHSRFFAAHKDENRYSKRNCFYVELIDGAYKEPEAEHIKNHKGIWVNKDKVKDIINIQEEKVSWDAFLNGEKSFTDGGILINSGRFTGLRSSKAREEMTKWLEEKGIGKKKVNYKMRDWVFSRQRYWGEPIPIIHCAKCGAVGVPEKDLPVRLPEVESYEPTGTGESPLANIAEWVNVKCPKCGGMGKRETNTMPQWAGSSWYYLRYIDPKNSQELVSKEKEKYWMPVNLYVGGAEHATRHLLYARFWHKFLYDIGVVSTEEPFKKLFHVGLILAEDGRKMSKRWGNVINPDDVIAEFGADSFRLYEMFMGPFSQSVSWSTKGVVGMRRFLERVWGIKLKVESGKLKAEEKKSNLERLVHKTIKKVSEDIEGFKFNTAISALMILSNEFEKEENLPKEYFEKFLILFSPFAPHIAEELWSSFASPARNASDEQSKASEDKKRYKESIFNQSWPEYDKDLIKEEEIEMLIQINGKLRDKIKVAADISEDEAKKLALANDKAKKAIEGKEIKKVIFVKGRLINIVI